MHRATRNTHKPKPDVTAKTRHQLVEMVLREVGRPDDLLKVEAKTVDRNKYRLNLVRESRGKVTRADSFFITTDENGNVLDSNPPLTRRYSA